MGVVSYNARWLLATLAMRRWYLLAVLSVGSRSGFMRSGNGRVADIIAGINDAGSDVAWRARSAVWSRYEVERNNDVTRNGAVASAKS